MSIKNSNISKLEDLDKLRSAPRLSNSQSKNLFKQVQDVIYKADWITIGVMSESLKEGINAIRTIEERFKFNEMKGVDLPTKNGPVFVKANQKTGEIRGRIEYGLGEGILISCHSEDNSLAARTIGPFPLDFFK